MSAIEASMPSRLKSKILDLTGKSHVTPSTPSSPPAAPAQAPQETMRVTRVARPFNKYVGQLPKSVLSVPSMMSVAERRFLYGLASSYYSGEGVIVDAGLFMGASTRCFGEGLRANPNLYQTLVRWKRPIFSFERGIVNSGMPAFFERNKIPTDAKEGDSFEPILRKNIEPVADLVDLKIGDIMETGKVDHPIEILFLDVLKLPEISELAVRRFFTRLIPEKSIVIQQDYFIDTLPFIKIHQEFFADYFEYLGEIGSMAIFRLVKAIPERVINELFAEPLAPATQLRLSSIALHRSIDPARRFMMALSKFRVVRAVSGVEAARAYLSYIKFEYPEQVESKFARLRNCWKEAERLVKNRKAKDFEPLSEDGEAAE